MATKTYKQAQAEIVASLVLAGWKVNTGLKVPHATSPDGRSRLWFKAQAIYLSQGSSHTLGDARSIHAGDIRSQSLASTMGLIAAWLK